MPYYGAGDYYGRGDYYQGDFLGIGKALKKVAGFAYNTLVPAPIRAVVSGVQGIIKGGQARAPFVGPPIAPSFQSPIGGLGPGGMVPLLPGEVLPGTEPTPVGTMLPQGFIPGMCGMKGTHPNKSTYYRAVPGQPLAGVKIPKGSVCVKNRSMNVANGRALGRALRRAYAFKKVAMRTVRLLNPTKPKRFGGFKKKR